MRVYLRRLAALTAAPVPGTEGATGLFFSPDGQWLGFDGGGVLKRVALAGGPPVVIGPAPGKQHGNVDRRRHASCSPPTPAASLQRMAVGGGAATPLTTPRRRPAATRCTCCRRRCRAAARCSSPSPPGAARHVAIADLA